MRHRIFVAVLALMAPVLTPMAMAHDGAGLAHHHPHGSEAVWVLGALAVLAALALLRWRSR